VRPLRRGIDANPPSRDGSPRPRPGSRRCRHPDRVNLEFQKCSTQGRFDPEGGRVEEELIDERIFVD
jgi:hypothetical protein